MTSSGAPPEREPITGLYLDVLAELVQIFGKNLSIVLEAYMRVEGLTNETNVIGRQNLIEAFSHLAVVLAKAPDLNRDEQLAQIAHLYDHLRRVMMESFEAEVNVTVASIWEDGGDKSIGRLYDARAAPQIRRGKLLGHLTPTEVEDRLDAIGADMVKARGAKVADGDFEEWATASRLMEEAAKEVRKLKKEVGAAVDAADANWTARTYMLIGLVACIICAAASVGFTLLLSG